jgi:cAMP-dependent protein kinase regulator
MKNTFIFKTCEREQQDILIDAMDTQNFKQGDMVITQGDDGNELYIVNDGQLECFKNIKGEDKHLRMYSSGEVFGELSLLYNTPRAANIKAQQDCSLFSLDRETFNRIVKSASVERRERYEAFLKQVDLFSKMDSYDLSNIIDCMSEERFRDNEKIITEGEQGNTFFVL